MKPTKSKPKKTRGNRLVDVALVLIVFLSIGLIVYRMRAPSTLNQATEGAAPPIRTKVAPSGIDAVTAPLTWYQWIASFQFVSDEEWKQFENRPDIRKMAISSTAPCKDTTAPKLWSLVIDSQEAVKTFRDGKMRVSFDPQNRLCISIGDQVGAYSISKNRDEPLFSHLGSVEIVSLLTLEVGKWHAEFLKLLKLDAANLDSHFARVAPGAKTVPAVRWSITKNIPPDSKIPKLQSLATPVLGDNFKHLVDRAAIFVDLRTEPSAALGKRTDYFHRPFTWKGKRSNRFTLGLLVKELDESDFDYLTIDHHLSSRSAPIVLMGTDEDDGRTLWAAVRIRELGLKNLYIAYEGAEAVERYFAAAAK